MEIGGSGGNVMRKIGVNIERSRMGGWLIKQGEIMGKIKK